MSVRDSIGVELLAGRLEVTIVADAPLVVADVARLERTLAALNAPAGTRMRVTLEPDGSLLLRAAWRAEG